MWDLHNTTVKEHHVLIEFERNDYFERRSVTFSSAGYQLVIGFCDGSIRVFDPQSENHLPSLQLTPIVIGPLTYPPIDQQLAIGGGDSSIYL